MSFFTWFIFGAFVGLVAFFIDPQQEQNSIPKAVLLGIVGAIIGGVLANAFFGIAVQQFHMTSFAIAVIVSLGLLFFGRRVEKI